jgi:beta-glucanase (GH16 family)
LNGDVELYANFVAGADSEWELVFSDEFNGADFSQPTSEKWMRCQRYGATWNRWLSDSEEVIYEQGGDLVARAIPNPDRSTDNVPMITGGIKSYGKFGFTYGIVEGRILSNPWTGNFPAFWMMPEDQSEGWPNCGEIDIWETIDTQHRSWHTVHSNWTYNLGNTGNPTSSFNVAVDLSRYHTYRLEWDAKTLVWYVDGKEVGRYTRGNTANVKKGQWPFNKHFHLILNQSVGNGSWAAPADESHTYETRFDWVRVYQKKGMKNTKETVGIEAAEVAPAHALEVVAHKGGVAVLTANPQPVMIYNASGLKVFSGDVDGQRNIPLPSGVYIVAGHKVVVS